MAMLQDEKEIETLADLFNREGVRSYLEIGCKFGDSLGFIANRLPVGSRIVAVDLPNGTKSWPKSHQAVLRLADDLKAKGYDVHVIWGDSQTRAVVDQVAALGPFDAAFIDADHRLPGVTNDWQNYGAMARIVAFHDIAWRRAADWVGTRIEVPQLWDQIKDSYAYQELKFCPSGKNNGIGVLWRR